MHIALAFAERLTPNNHVLEVLVTGLRNSASSGFRVDIDAFVSWP